MVLSTAITTHQKNKAHELKILLKTILEQNYLQFSDRFYKKNEGLAMGAPTSAILAKIFIQYLQYPKIIKILNKHQIVDYHRYVGDILIIYNAHTTNINKALNKINAVHPITNLLLKTQYTKLLRLNHHKQTQPIKIR
jgi:hypothetical protein